MNFSFLLQATPEASTQKTTTTYQSVWDIIDKSNEGLGLTINLIILAMAAWTIFVFIERFLAIRKAVESEKSLLKNVKADLESNNIQGALAKCTNTDSPVAKMLEKGIQKIDRSSSELTSTIENTGKFEVLRLEQRLNSLATMAGAAPMVGFLGTVIGMVQAFISIAQEEGSVSPKLLADGIYTAMITTVAGLLVGIIAYLGYNYLVTRVSKVVHKMEYSAIEFIDLLQEPR